MEKNRILEKFLSGTLLLSLLFAATVLSLPSCRKKQGVRVGISPYQDIAMMVNARPLGLEEKYGVKVDLATMAWEDILPAVASAGRTVDVGFGSLTEYLTKYNNLNKGAKDPVLFLYPAYIYKGGGFLSFNGEVPEITMETFQDDSVVQKFLSYRIGAQKNSIYEMIIFSLARKVNKPFKSVKMFDIPLDEGFLASQGGNAGIDIASVGLTQVAEGLKNGGRLVLEMENIGFADITGFICKQSTYERKKEQVEAVIRMWFDCVDHVFQNLDENSRHSLKYLNEKAATRYTLEQYKMALSQEYFPKSLEEASKVIVSNAGRYSYRHISQDIVEYLHSNGIINEAVPIPEFLDIQK